VLFRDGTDEVRDTWRRFRRDLLKRDTAIFDNVMQNPCGDRLIITSRFLQQETDSGWVGNIWDLLHWILAHLAHMPNRRQLQRPHDQGRIKRWRTHTIGLFELSSAP
jgi:hypothetical protein